jgi:hypothetical protein
MTGQGIVVPDIRFTPFPEGNGDQKEGMRCNP